MKRTLPLFLIAMLMAAAILFIAADFAGGIFGFVPDWRWAGLVSLLAMTIWLTPSLARYRGHASTALTYLAIWLAIAVLVALVYVYRGELGLPAF